jgi:hypothetical protein
MRCRYVDLLLLVALSAVCCLRCAALQERRERLMKEQLEKMRADNPKITEQFADLKRDLAQVGIAKWTDGMKLSVTLLAVLKRHVHAAHIHG